jgi:murein DD-endopeptidase MepM/ murein hydrolase activator NlpD
MKYPATSPKEFAKDIIKQKIKNLFMAHPIIITIIIVCIVLFFLIFMMILGLAGDNGEQAKPNKFDYNQFMVTADGTEFSLDAYTLSAIYLEFFIRHDISNFSSLTDEQFKNAISTYALYTKVTVLKNGVFDANKGDYTGNMPNNKDKYPAVCDAFNGCKERGIIFDSWKWYEAYPSDSEIENKDKEYPGLFAFEEGSYADKRANLAREAVVEVNGKIVSQASQNGVIPRIDDDYLAPRIDEERYEWIVETAKTGMGYEDMVKAYAKKFWADNNDVKIYNVYDYIIDEEVAYIDNGFWWPIGSTTLGADGLYSGTPAYTSLSSPFGWRINDAGERVYHSGIDIPTGGLDDQIPVLAVDEGEVTYQGCTPYKGYCGFDQTSNEFSGGGCAIYITHTNGLVTKYLHLSKQSYNAFVKFGDQVTRGQQIARVGSTGCSTGPHLHFTIIDGTGEINPLNYISENNPRSIN